MKISKWILLCAHKPEKDPRIEWIISKKPKNLKISPISPEISSQEKLKKKFLKKLIKLLKIFLINLLIKKANSDDLNIIIKIQKIIKTKKALIKYNFTRKDYHIAMSKIKEIWEITYILIWKLIERKENIDGIIACDLICLPAGIFGKVFYQVPLVYDAHEYFSEEEPNLSKKVRKFYKEIEVSLFRHADKKFIVSPFLSQLAKEEHKMQFSTLPNAEPK